MKVVLPKVTNIKNYLIGEYRFKLFVTDSFIIQIDFEVENNSAILSSIKKHPW